GFSGPFHRASFGGSTIMRGFVWFRRDLRVHDNPALSAAVEECDEVIGLFVFDEPLLRSGIFGSACVNFMLGCLGELALSLARGGIRLQWRRGNRSKKRFVPRMSGRRTSFIGIVTTSRVRSNG